jgi:biopolymer transport protein ExbD
MKFRSPARQALFAPLSNPHDPVPQMNTTPLIDVLLVLLVILIITIPVQSHKLPIDLPAGPASGKPPVTHRLTLAANGAYAWDGAALPDAALGAKLAALVNDPARPALVIETDGETRYDRFDATMAMIKRAGVTKLGFAGNERWR